MAANWKIRFTNIMLLELLLLHSIYIYSAAQNYPQGFKNISLKRYTFDSCKEKKISLCRKILLLNILTPS